MVKIGERKMSKKARDKIAAGLREAIAFARGEKQAARIYVPEIDVRAAQARAEGSDPDAGRPQKR
jgi:hypothetical protein